MSKLDWKKKLLLNRQQRSVLCVTSLNYSTHTFQPAITVKFVVLNQIKLMINYSPSSNVDGYGMDVAYWEL